MQQHTVKLTTDEIQALLELVENQLFRVKFIDPKIPGYKTDPAKVRLANSAVATLREICNKAKGFQMKGAAA